MEDQPANNPPAQPEPPTDSPLQDIDTTVPPPDSSSAPEPTAPTTAPSDTPISVAPPESAIPTEPPTPVAETPSSEPVPNPNTTAAPPEPTPQPATLPPDPEPSPLTASELNKPSSADIVASLTDEQLKAAAALYARKHQAELSRAGVRKRQAVAEQNITAILQFVSSHSPASNRTIARALNLPPRRVQHYMQLLTHRGDITATGWGASREYRIK